MTGRPAAILLALLAAGTLPAAKPLPPADAPADAAAANRERLRGQGISLCVEELRAVPSLGPDDLEAICGCAVDRSLEGAAGDMPVRLEPRLEARIISCTAALRPPRLSDVAEWRAARVTQGPAPVSDVPAMDGKPDAGEEEADAADPGSAGSGGGLGAWLGNLALPAWLTGASLLWWIALGIFVFGLLILKIRRHDPRRDLDAPPAHLRRGASSQPPRRPDLPR